MTIRIATTLRRASRIILIIRIPVSKKWLIKTNISKYVYWRRIIRNLIRVGFRTDGLLGRQLTRNCTEIVQGVYICEL